MSSNNDLRLSDVSEVSLLRRKLWVEIAINRRGCRSSDEGAVCVVSLIVVEKGSTESELGVIVDDSLSFSYLSSLSDDYRPVREAMSQSRKRPRHVQARH